jgi:hypothetical protein
MRKLLIFTPHHLLKNKYINVEYNALGTACDMLAEETKCIQSAGL